MARFWLYYTQLKTALKLWLVLLLLLVQQFEGVLFPSQRDANPSLHKRSNAKVKCLAIFNKTHNDPSPVLKPKPLSPAFNLSSIH